MDRWRSLPSLGALKWVPPANLHLTLCFLGNVAAGHVGEVEERLEDIPPPGPISLELGGLGCFPNSRRPAVVWAGLGGGLPTLFGLQTQVAEACRDFVEKADRRAFSPHLTLARVKNLDRIGVARLRELLVRDADLDFGSWSAQEFRLMRSELGREGSTYRVIRTFAV